MKFDGWVACVGTNVGKDFLRRKSVLTLGLDLGRPMLHEE